MSKWADAIRADDPGFYLHDTTEGIRLARASSMPVLPFSEDCHSHS